MDVQGAQQDPSVTQVRELVVDGVRVFHLPGPGKTRAALTFGVGLQDESFETVGLTHLVEHLAVAELPASFLDASASVAVDHTEFTASGRPEEVGDLLRRVCEALADLPVAQLERAQHEVLTEGTVASDLSMAAAWTARYGFAGLGLASIAGHGPLAVTAEEVLAHAAEHFARERAVLAVFGPLPDGLSLPLRAGTPAPPRRHPEPHLGDGPQWVAGQLPGIALLLDGLEPYDGVAGLAGDVLRERLQDVARTRHGLSYSVASELMYGGDGDVLTFALDFREGRAADVAALLWRELSDLATQGPTQVELDHAVAGAVAELDLTDSDVAEAEPFRIAFLTLLGRRVRPLAEIAAGLAGTTCEDVRDLLAVAQRRALVVVPDEERMPEQAQQAAPISERSWCSVGHELPPGKQLRPKAIDRIRYRGARRTLVLTEQSIALRDEDSEVHEVRWDEVAGVVAFGPPPGIAVFGRNACFIPLHPGVYGKAAYEDVVTRLAPQVERLQRKEELAAQLEDGGSAAG